MKTPTPKNTLLNPKTGRISITDAFGANLAALLATKIVAVHLPFDIKGFVDHVRTHVVGQTYTQRVESVADALQRFLPSRYTDALAIGKLSFPLLNSPIL